MGAGRSRRFCGATCRSGARRERTGQSGSARAAAPFAAALREGLQESTLPLRAVCERLGHVGQHVAASTLSHWQQGKSAPPLTAANLELLIALERLLGMPPAALVDALVQRHPSAHWPRPVTASRHKAPVRPTAAERLEWRRREFDRELFDRFSASRIDLALVRQSECYRIGENHRPVSSRFDLTACAIGDGVGSYWAVCLYEPPVRTTIRPLYGCRLGEVLDETVPRDRAGARRFRAVELCFDPDRQLRRRATHEFGFQLEYLDAASNDLEIPLAEREFFRHLTTAACRDLRLAIEFTGSEQPVGLTRGWTPPRSDVAGRSAPVALVDGRDEIHEVDPSPGTYGWRWTWSREDQVAPVKAGHVVGG